MATATEYTPEQLNYYRICYVATDIVAEGLRTIFKQEWDNRYKATLGKWKDEPRNGLAFFNAESRRSQRRNAHLLNTITKGDRAEWDCTMLFYAILYSDCIGHGLHAMVQLNVDDLRRFRNKDFAHMPQGQLSDLDFQIAMGKVRVAFQALGLSTVQIQDITNQTTFPTDELKGVLDKVEDLKRELKEKYHQLQEKETQRQGLEGQLQEKETQRQGLEGQLQEKETQRQVLEDQLQNDIPPFCILPPKPSHDVAGRDSEVATITQQLKELKQVNENNLSYLYLSGNPGSGKSQLAGLVAKRFYGDAQEDPFASTFVMTLNAESLDTVLESYFSFARQLKCPEYAVTGIINSKDMKIEVKIANLKALISTKIGSYKSWLLVVDNVKSIPQTYVYLPKCGNKQWARGQLLITTQDTTSIPLTNSFIRHVSVSKGMESNESICLLAKLSGIDDNEKSKMVAQALDYQPLALASAATYIKQIRLSKITSHFGWNEYLDKLEKGKRAITETILTETNPSYPKSMTAAITLAVEGVIESDKVTLHAFSLLSLCAPQPLSTEIMINYIHDIDDDIEDEEMIMIRFQRCSLLLLEEEETGVYIHVHQVVRDVIKTVIKDYLASHRLEALNGAVTAFNRFIPDNWQDLNSIMQSNITYLQQLGPEHVDVAATYGNLGSVHQALGDFEQAKDYHHRALEIRLKQLGPEHVDVATTYAAYSNLGAVHQDLGDFEQAKDYHSSCSRNSALGDFEQAKDYHHRDLQISLKQLGPEHVHVATTYSNLGSVHQALGDFEQAKDYHDRDLQISLKQLGPEHVDVAATYANLGSVHQALGDFEQAKEYHHRALDIRLKQLGPEHVNVATTYSNFGSVHQALGYFEQAKDYHHRDLQISLKQLGPEHVNVATTYSNLGSVHQDLGAFEQAKTIIIVLYKLV
ncbi:hypothetical protein OS493_027759 [Desmophyllum pertusum]|uniref:Nephrocystin-3 n=1 Tax=Desmophyllum pertusum TaxID=174260 RepID=A0A9W9ZAD0_9CNID|nr:hypothetical protein OS493_027759 [Desmophyllum pertusum]